MEKVMSEYKAGDLKSGGDKKVTNRKQAIAIGLAMDYKANGKKSKNYIETSAKSIFDRKFRIRMQNYTF